MVLLATACTTVPPPDAGTGTSPPATPGVVTPDAPVNVPGIPSDAKLTRASLTQLPGWSEDRLLEAWPALLRSCDKLAAQPLWKPICAGVRTMPADEVAARAFVEANFDVWSVASAEGKTDGVMTGYYEPVLRASLVRRWPFVVPLYGPPDDLVSRDQTLPDGRREKVRGRMVNGQWVPYYSRGELTPVSGKTHPALHGKEIAWVEDAIDAFFLQVQGSGRLVLPDGRVLRAGFADTNGLPYKSIGRVLIDRGELRADAASAQAIKAWARANPSRTQELLNQNPSFIFFRFLPGTPDQGPIGSLNVPLTERRSIAVDPRFIPLGAPVWLSAQHLGRSINQLALAQDTGTAIKGEVRADYFWGAGDKAGEDAGRMRAPLQLWLLWPKAAP